jgi:hypothetical protein
VRDSSGEMTQGPSTVFRARAFPSSSNLAQKTGTLRALWNIGLQNIKKCFFFCLLCSGAIKNDKSDKIYKIIKKIWT